MVYGMAFEPSSMLNILWERITIALTTLPTPHGWMVAAGIFVLYGLLALGIGSISRFLHWNSPVDNWLQISAQVFGVPAFLEEIIFRILLVPHPSKTVSLTSWWLYAGISLLLFLLYHPLNALTLYKAGNPLFFTPSFLIQATLIGLACTLAYKTTGSAWPPILIHWVPVVIWLCWLGGYEHLTASSET
ncbi:MAG: type II CAAX prenyl endopeptidase Rce1 family protein [Leptolyngbyaceae cyanobacterium]